MEETLKNKLVNEQLSSIEFIQDYLQLHFDGRTITIYVWPEVSLNNQVYRFSQASYRNKICELIGKKIIDLHYKHKEYITIDFENGSGNVKINLDPSDPETVSEIAIFNDSLDSTWIVFD